jgi:ABC-type polysaccharide/polyol phosphate transport system ATPase subunit
MIAVSFDHVCKSFARHAGRMLIRERLTRLVRGERSERFQALTGVSFLLRHGESLGIVGHNGAGKSTILNLITGLCLPTAGRVVVDGRVAALLELGSGFHLDLTGAENLRMNAALLGLTRQETAARFPAIVDFAGIGDFIDEPLRTYSAGMMMRLAFAVAIHVDPDILLVDEVLGVGDYSFFEKCFQRIEAFRRGGKTIVCVSHSLDAIESLCSRVIWLDHGRVFADGPASLVLDRYRAHGGQARQAAIPN